VGIDESFTSNHISLLIVYLLSTTFIFRMNWKFADNKINLPRQMFLWDWLLITKHNKNVMYRNHSPKQGLCSRTKYSFYYNVGEIHFTNWWMRIQHYWYEVHCVVVKNVGTWNPSNCWSWLSNHLQNGVRNFRYQISKN